MLNALSASFPFPEVDDDDEVLWDVLCPDADAKEEATDKSPTFHTCTVLLSLAQAIISPMSGLRNATDQISAWSVPLLSSLIKLLWPVENTLRRVPLLLLVHSSDPVLDSVRVRRAEEWARKMCTIGYGDGEFAEARASGFFAGRGISDGACKDGSRTSCT